MNKKYKKWMLIWRLACNVPDIFMKDNYKETVKRLFGEGIYDKVAVHLGKLTDKDLLVHYIFVQTGNNNGCKIARKFNYILFSRKSDGYELLLFFI